MKKKKKTSAQTNLPHWTSTPDSLRKSVPLGNLQEVDEHHLLTDQALVLVQRQRDARNTTALLNKQKQQ